MPDRKHLKRERARYDVVQGKIGASSARLAELERERDASEELYQRDVQPLQAELAAIEEEAITAIQERRPLDPAREQRRNNLPYEIETAGVILTNKIADIDSRVAIVKAERQKLMATLPNRGVIDADLFRSGDPAKQLRHHGLTEAVSGIRNSFLFSYSRRVEAVRDAMRSAKDNGHKSQAEDYRKQLDRMEAVLSAVSEATTQMQRESENIYHELIEA